MPRKFKIFFSIFATVLLLFAVKKFYDFAAPPKFEKVCDFVYPQDSDLNIQFVDKNFELLDQKGGTVNDASCLNQTAVYGVVKVKSIEDVRDSIIFAKENNLKIMSSGQKHSMGGQAFSRGGLVLDMREFNQLTVDKENKMITVQSGATWEQVQKALDKEGLAVKAMQSINIVTVGGTLSANAHGIAHNPGQVANTVKSFRLILSDGRIVNVSPTENAELFKHVLGGYGLFGVILDVDLEVTDNEMYAWERNYIDYKEFPEYFKNNIENNNDIGLMYGRLSVSPLGYLKDTTVHTFVKTQYTDVLPEIKEDKHTWVTRFVINFSKTGAIGRWTRWVLEKHLAPALNSCTRNQAMSQKEVCIVTRNQEMSEPMKYLKNNLKDTDILQEYFIPKDKMPEFVDGLREIVTRNGSNLLNVTIRGVSQDEITALPYSKGDNFAFVLYFNQKLNEEESKKLETTTKDLIDLSIKLGGRYYLPYQLHYSKEQLHSAYHEIDSFFAKKRQYDPNEIFSSKFYEKYK